MMKFLIEFVVKLIWLKKSLKFQEGESIMFISEEDKQTLQEAINLIRSIPATVDYEFKEFLSLNTAIDSLKVAIDKERIYKNH